jgi:crotonobetainyl-CoA:carnitine CoA-transferase CaiB-like acyl-CoA transferase
VSSKSVLTGIRVVEMTEALAGPYCSMLLGDLGADVVKVERPGVGDQSRAWGPPFLESESAYYLSVNRNKRSIELDIKTDEDLAVLHSLIEKADVFLTNLPRMSSLERARIDPESAQQGNPRLIYAAISGYGHSGPKAGRSGYDLIAQGEAGSMALTGAPGDGPVRFPTPMADISAGIYATVGILAALYERDKERSGSGRGQFIDISLVDSQVTWLANVGGSYFANGERPPKMGNLHPSITPYQPMQARDKVMIVAVGTERLWAKFCQVLGVEEALMRDPRFATNRDRNRHREELIPRLEEILVQRDADTWVEELVQAGIPAGPVNYPDQILADEHLASRRMIVELEHPLIGLVRSIGNPINLSATGVSYRRHPPRLGEHNGEIRAELAR